MDVNSPLDKQKEQADRTKRLLRGDLNSAERAILGAIVASFFLAAIIASWVQDATKNSRGDFAAIFNTSGTYGWAGFAVVVLFLTVIISACVLTALAAIKSLTKK